MNTRTMFIVAASVAIMITGCESLDKGALAGGGLAATSAAKKGDKKTQAAVAAGATTAAIATASNRPSPKSAQSSEGERSVPMSKQVSPSVGDAERLEKLRSEKLNEEAQAEVAQPTTTKPEEVKEKPVSIATISDDKEFFDAFKKTEKKDESLFSRATRMKDEKLLAEFVRMYPKYAKELAQEWYYEGKDSEFAEVLIDNLQDPSLKGSIGWVSIPGIDKMLFNLAKTLDAKARAKYLARAEENRKKLDNDVLVLEKFYIGMPVIDYVMISLEDKQEWAKQPGAVIDWLDYRADMKTDISGQDWRTAWKIKDLSFDPKSRHKYFKVKGTREGLLEFAKKYCDKSATYKDITIDGNWWQYNDDEHGLKVFLNDNSGYLNITNL